MTKVRIIAEYLWRRLEQIYEGKLQTWKQNEEKMIEEMIARLRRQYRQNLLLKEKEVCISDHLSSVKQFSYEFSNAWNFEVAFQCALQFFFILHFMFR